jgi:hypothetical protein
MKKLAISILMSFGTIFAIGQTNQSTTPHGSQEKFSEETHVGHDHGPSGTKGCDPEMTRKLEEIKGNGNCPALTDYVIVSTGKKFFEAFPDFPPCPNLGNMISDKDGYYKAINDWCLKHPNDSELVHQILGFSTEVSGK